MVGSYRNEKPRGREALKLEKLRQSKKSQDAFTWTL